VEDVEEQSDVLGLVLTAILVCFALMGLSISGFSAYRHFLPAVGYFMFLCHHKDGSGSLARFMKNTVLADTRFAGPVFLDSDQLEEVDLIFDIIRTLAKNFVLLGSKMVLTRPWCAGEIATACANKIPHVTITCEDFEWPDDASLTKVGGLWSEQQKLQLCQYGIGLPCIQTAYRRLATLPSIELNRFSPVKQQEAAIKDLIQRCQTGGGSGMFSTMSNMSTVSSMKKAVDRLCVSEEDEETMPARIIIAGCVWDAETRCSCEVLRNFIQVKTQVVTKVVYSAEDAQPFVGYTQYLLAVLTKGVLQDDKFAAVLVLFSIARQKEPVDIVTVLADTSFSFPAPDFYTDIEKKGDRGMHLATSFRKMLNILALPFSPHGSSGIMTTQATEICRRFRLSEQHEMITYQVTDAEVYLDSRVLMYI